MNHRLRLSGVVLPLFSMRSRNDWGIGHITDLPLAAAWVKTAGQSLLQVLPPYDLADGETSPYGARTAFGIDPSYIDPRAVEDLDEAAIDQALGPEGKATLEKVAASSYVMYKEARALKRKVLRAAFERFHEREWQKGTARAQAFRAFIEKERAWLQDLALYVALRRSHGDYGWHHWPEGERDRDPSTLDRARKDHEKAILEYQYEQWLALDQWERARATMASLDVELMGDVPFIVGTESADVWSHRSQFRTDVSLGAPPDGFAPEGQDWGLPSYHWAAMDNDGLAWVVARTAHAARLYDRFRLDHVVGYFRQWVRRAGQPGYFDPDGEHAQAWRGEHVLSTILRAAGEAKVIGEDLGVIPPFVRHCLVRLGLPGYRVLPWERDEHHQLRDPMNFPPESVATWSTHDTAPITQWWHEFQDYERRDVLRLVGAGDDLSDDARTEALLRFLMRSSSNLTLILAQELTRETTRINLPGTVGDSNWTYRLPAALEDLMVDPVGVERMRRLAQYARESGRVDL